DVGAVGAGLGERDELVAEVDERHPRPARAAQRHLEPALVPGQRLFEVAHLERDVVDPDRAYRHAEELNRQRAGGRTSRLRRRSPGVSADEQWRAGGNGSRPNARVRVARLAARQHGRLTDAQLRGLGVGADTARYWRRTAYLHRTLPGVFAVGSVDR